MAGYIDNSSDNALFASYSSGRATGAKLMGNYDLAQWSAVLDSSTCDFCGWSDERIFSTKTNPEQPPVHWGCRCIIAYILPEEYPPDPDWGPGPPKSAFPPGRKHGASKSGKPVLRNEGKVPKPKTGPTVDYTDELKSMPEFDPGADPRAIQKQLGDRVEAKMKEMGVWSDDADQFFRVMTSEWTAQSTSELRELFATLGSGDVAALKNWFLNVEPSARAYIDDLLMRTTPDEIMKHFTYQYKEPTTQYARMLLGDEVTLYRGVRSSGGTLDDVLKGFVNGDMTEGVISANKIESWTTSLKTAEEFAATFTQGGAVFQKGVVFQKAVSVDDLAMSWWSNGKFASWGEQEVLWLNYEAAIVPKAFVRKQTPGLNAIVEVW